MGDTVILVGPLIIISAMMAGIYVVVNQIASSLSRIASALERLEKK